MRDVWLDGIILDRMESLLESDLNGIKIKHSIHKLGRLLRNCV